MPLKGQDLFPSSPGPARGPRFFRPFLAFAGVKTLTQQSRSRVFALTLASVCLFALGVRLLGLGYGLPAVYNPDETPILNRALAFAKGDPNPHNFLYPSLYFYAVFAWESLFFVIGRAAGIFSSLAAFQREFFTDPSRLFLAARAFTALCGALTVPALYWFGRRLYGRSAGLAAALFYAIAPIAVRDAHYVKLDVPVTLAVVLAHGALARIVVDLDAAARRSTWMIAGLLAGLAISTHYYVGLIVFSFIAVAIADRRRSSGWQESVRLLAWAGVAMIAGFFAGTPFMLVEPGTALRDITALREIDVDRAVVGGAFVSVGAYLDMLLRDAVGWPVCLAAAAGAVWAVFTDWRRGVVLVTFPLVFLMFLANTVPMTRYLNALLPAVALAAAFAVTRVARPLGKLAPAVTAILALAAAAPGLAGTIRTDLFIREADTRTLAREFIEASVPAGSTILVQPYSVPLRQSRDALTEALRANLGSPERASIKFRLQLEHASSVSPTYRMLYLGDGGLDPDKIYVSPRAFATDGRLDALRPLKVDYVILKRFNVEDRTIQRLAASLARDGRLLAQFSPYRDDASPAVRRGVSPFLHNTALRIDPALQRPGPIIQVWRIDRSN
jgi:hypothetical protein